MYDTLYSAMKPLPQSVINYRALRAEKARLGLEYKDLIERTGQGSRTIAACLNGAETINLQTLIDLAAALNLRVKVDFESMEKSDGEQKPVQLQAVA